jgi:hypothetical protein
MSAMFSDTGRVEPPDTGRSGMGGILAIVHGVPIWAATTAVGGLICGIIGLIRRERWRRLSVAGLLLCGAILALTIWSAMAPTSGPPS